MNDLLSRRVLYSGKAEPEPPHVLLRAGPLSLFYDSGDLRYIKLGECEVIRRIYAAVRDRNWRTIPAVLSNPELERAENSFVIRYKSEHKEGEIDFFWRAEIRGDASGIIRFTFDGEARSTFSKNRIGFCVLHPIRECVGAPCRVEYVDGRRASVTFPKLVTAEQPLPGLQDLRAIAHEITPGLWAEVRFEGDVFEMEDQRNWIDASFKTFCTPLRIPFPAEIKAGQKVQQTVTLRLLDERADDDGLALASLSHPRQDERKLEIGQDGSTARMVTILINSSLPGRPLPAIGLGSPIDEEIRFRPKRMHKRLKALDLSHVRVDLKLSACDWIATLFHTLEWAERLKLGLEIALYPSKSAKKEIQDLISYPPLGHAKIARFLIFEKNAMTPSPGLLEMVRRRLQTFRPGVPIGTGTNADFYELNQVRPRLDLCDFVCWSISPQVHAFDNASLAETPEAVRQQIESARKYFPGKPIVVSPITFKPRFNAVATGPEPPAPPGELPRQVDPRQMSLFGAGWTLAIMKHLAEAGADSVTLFETTGWRGVMETAAGSPLPDKFASIPSAVFPLYHVLGGAGDFAGGEVIVSKSSDPLKVESLVLRNGPRTAVVLANLTDEQQRVCVTELSGRLSIKRLDETNAERAMTEPEKFRAERGDAMQAEQGRVELELNPYAIIRIDSAK